ncbi:hypothetical protein Q8A67_002142 [Cirrhinus molitorella]|uniref:Uncharacterized protein n=1 Tax=Cirrhinus molitorella TaxID=172907 RepID=A0AA88QD90_9TELE|nr:hypothetical protein Q8A67_002142 [Cirrhinus molitorella]
MLQQPKMTPGQISFWGFPGENCQSEKYHTSSQQQLFLRERQAETTEHDRLISWNLHHDSSELSFQAKTFDNRETLCKLPPVQMLFPPYLSQACHALHGVSSRNPRRQQEESLGLLSAAVFSEGAAPSAEHHPVIMQD